MKKLHTNHLHGESTFTYPFETFEDTSTGKRYQRISPKGILAHYPYFYLNMFNQAGNTLLMILEHEGNRNIFLLDMEKETAKQVTFYHKSDGFQDFGPRFGPDGSTLIYVVNNQVVRLNIESGHVDVLYEPEEGWETYSVVDASSDGQYLVTIDFLKSDYVNKDNSNWEDFMLQGQRGLRSKLLKIHIESKEVDMLLDTFYYEAYGLKKNQWLGHPQFKPGDNHMICYCHEGFGGTVDARIWLMNTITRDIHCPRKHTYEGEIISHEFFTHDGEKLGFVRIAHDDSDKGSLRFVNMNTFKEETIMDLPRCSHFITDAKDNYIIADADYPAKPYLYFIDINKKKTIPLLLHNSSMKSYGNTQDAHPHPVFTPDSNHVLFVSDMEGYPAIYMASVEEFVREDKRNG